MTRLAIAPAPPILAQLEDALALPTRTILFQVGAENSSLLQHSFTFRLRPRQ